MRLGGRHEVHLRLHAAVAVRLHGSGDGRQHVLAVRGRQVAADRHGVYAVWTGIGAVSTAVFGMILFHEPATVARICCILLVVSGIVGLAILEK